MANRFFNPNEQFCDGSGLPYAGGSLAFYASGTSTPLNTYSDSGLSIANTNPVVLDSAGRAGSIFLQNLAYKVVLSDVNNNQIWTEDPVYTSDYSARAVFTSGAGSPNGSVAGTAGSTGIGASVYWDDVNFILYVCTQTGTASTAVWTAVNASTAAAVVPTPQGYLTPVSGTPVITSDSVSSTSLVYTPFVGNVVPVYNGTSFVPTVFSELTLTLTASQAASTIYDVFVFNNSGVLTLVTGPAWSSSTAGSCTRGTGAGTTQLSRLSGLLVNTVSMSGRNSSNTYTIPASQATYLGSLFMDTSAGQVSCYRSYGPSRKFGIWNAYNRKRIILEAGTSTASWSAPAPSTVRAANGDATMSLTTFTGLAEEFIDLLSFRTALTATSTGTGGSVQVTTGIGVNATTSYSGQTAVQALAGTTGGGVADQIELALTSYYQIVPGLGINTVTACESAQTSGATQTFFGTAASFLLKSDYWG